jgi:hypothetical protein
VLKNSFTGTGIWPDEKVGRSDRSIIDDRHPADGFVTLKNRQADKLKEFFNTILRNLPEGQFTLFGIAAG